MIGYYEYTTTIFSPVSPIHIKPLVLHMRRVKHVFKTRIYQQISNKRLTAPPTISRGSRGRDGSVERAAVGIG